MSRCARPQYLIRHDWISGFALSGTLTQTDWPYGASLAFGAAVRQPASIPHALAGRSVGATLTRPFPCSCLWLLVTSSRTQKGLAPSIVHPCLTHRGRATAAAPSVASVADFAPELARN
jgi:hypothetical protein